MGRSKWLLVLLVPMLFGFDTAGPFRTRNGFRSDNFTIGAGGGGVVENTCASMGTSCLMSEPLNTDTYNCVSDIVDFADSEGTGAKEATQGGNQGCGRTHPYASSTADVALPTGTSNVSYVMREEVQAQVMTDTHTLTGMKRMCMRHYHKFSASYSNSIVCGSDKLMEFWNTYNGGTTAIQFTEYSNVFMLNGLLGEWTNAKDGDHSSDPTASYNIRTSPTMRISDCQDNWCRFETCLSTTDSDLANLTNVTMQTRVTQVGVVSPVDAYTPAFFIGSATHGTLGETWPQVVYRDDVGNSTTCNDHNPDTWGHSYYTHVMKAAWTTNEDQWIGEACEVESGC